MSTTITKVTESSMPKPQRKPRSRGPKKATVTTTKTVHSMPKNPRATRKQKAAGFINRNGQRYVIGKGNIADPRNIVASMGATGPGRSWAVRALHPCGEDLTGTLRGIPDRTSMPICCPEGRLFTNVTKPSLSVRTQPEGNDFDWGKVKTWNLCIISLPSDRGLIVLQANASDAFVDTNPAENASIGVWNWVKPDATPSDSVTVASAACMILEVPVISSSTSLESVAQSFRVDYFGVTTHLNAPALSNQGRVVAGQVTGNYHQPELTNPSAQAEVWDIHVLMDQVQLTQTDVSVYNGEAKKGVYLPHRIANPVVNLKQIPKLPRNVRINPPSDGEIVGGDLGDTAFIDTDWLVGVQFYLGIDPAASVDVKVRLGLEFGVSFDSPWRPFVMKSPLLDQKALDVVATLAQSEPHAYEAKYNDLGKILNNIGSGLGQMGIPIVSDVANTVTPIVSTIGSMLGSLFGI